MEPSIAHAVIPATSYDETQLSLIKNTISKDLSNDEFSLLVEVAKRTGLDLFTRQLYGIKRGGQMTIQTGIDGYRLMAARTGNLAGIDDAIFDTEEKDHPGKASVTVWRFVHRQRVPFTATARWAEYKSDSGTMWKKMPYLILRIDAEALALRKAFPAELSGIYTQDEMDQAESEPAESEPAMVVNAVASTTSTTTKRAQVQERMEQSVWSKSRPPHGRRSKTVRSFSASPENSLPSHEPFTSLSQDGREDSSGSRSLRAGAEGTGRSGCCDGGCPGPGRRAGSRSRLD